MIASRCDNTEMCASAREKGKKGVRAWNREKSGPFSQDLSGPLAYFYTGSSGCVENGPQFSRGPRRMEQIYKC